MAARAFGEGPRGFSLDASLMGLATPYSRAISVLDLPGTYSGMVLTQGAGSGTFMAGFSLRGRTPG